MHILITNRKHNYSNNRHSFRGNFQSASAQSGVINLQHKITMLELLLVPLMDRLSEDRRTEDTVHQSIMQTTRVQTPALIVPPQSPVTTAASIHCLISLLRVTLILKSPKTSLISRGTKPNKIKHICL